jgi:ketosteroid isomerase-like protein
VGVVDDLVARLDRVEAELALHRLAADYCVGADHRDLARWRAVWTADAVWQTSPDQAITGIDAICAAAQRQWRAFPVMLHATTNHVVTLDGDTAAGRSDVLVMVQLQDQRWIVGGGTYHDDYRREHGTWRIARRGVVRPFDLAPLAPSLGPIYDEEP